MRRQTSILALAATLALAGCMVEVGPEDPGLDDPQGMELVNPSRSTMTSPMPPCHTPLATYDGTTAYSNGPYTGTGSSCGGSAASGLRYQCPEVVMRHFMAKWGFRWWGNAKDLLATAPADKTDVYYNGDPAHPPVPGDALVWTKGAYGHVALISAVTATSVSIIEQNWAGSGTATFAYANGQIASRGNGWLPAGWVHAKANTATTTPSQPSQPPSQPPPSQPPAPQPPSVSWTCSASSYQGQQIWTCSGSARYRCENGTPVKEECPGGCQSNPLGTDDVCLAAPPVSWTCSASSYQGQQIWTCSGSARYRCENGTPVKDDCPGGCQSNPLGTDDVCL